MLMNLQSGSGRLAVGPIAPGLFDNLSTERVSTTEPGILIVYVDNQTIGKDVWFDNVQVLHYNTKVLEENHYYPFGLTVSNKSLANNQQPLKYNGKELETSFDLQTYEYGARQYNSQIGRWNGVDPLAHKFVNETPYNYAGNNPIKNIDVGGMYKMDAKQAKEYKVLASYLKNNVQSDIMKSQLIMDAMFKYSGGNLTRSEIAKATKWNSGPTVKVIDDPGFNGGANGRYDYSTNTIYINTKIAKQLENAGLKDIQAALLGLYVTLTHETIHFGDYIDGQRQDADDPSGFGGEPGTAFANDVFYTQLIESEGEVYKVIDPGSDHTVLNDAKKLIERFKKAGTTELIPTPPDKEIKPTETIK